MWWMHEAAVQYAVTWYVFPPMTGALEVVDKFGQVDLVFYNPLQGTPLLVSGVTSRRAVSVATRLDGRERKEKVPLSLLLLRAHRVSIPRLVL